ncbi:NADH-quinone oxidoreductase subunit NuoN [Parvibaculum sp.]|jgi:NADH-quinone oxidoreductase subunit N|uniref:NADH-quinone oxidoreductase subunit NuoN n=2 Tax=Parvibaculum sp. TaxID=2024848 RepID=UPI000C524CEE|nr:NADH-quinone oxidoreductase subunit NuoN [Parvibaculum sp.]MAU60663.1 NADH-quinone oxidoreductase subunit NuoN [Parvibaculum sp.]MBO6667539.1 NADH-quinone oxidoreductase subunit NuoN [Parvibaculum sp.]MBO6714091.1 NADH-quinone oxidoreductase subunit NuoN [Parvibaculum sp.]HAC60312.1 NADH-quinone oxidoreductase subunit NuoN [Rhodobiaceae bacterium]|tara:strand:- start:3975 stop:5423 length:1449 start_codon:yes stop_codon:yes gene_type:complete
MEQAVTHVPDFLPALPEILMAAGAMALLMWGVFRKCDARETGIGAIGLLVLVGALLVIEPNAAVQTFGGMFVVDGFTKFMKLLILLAAIAAIIMSFGYIRREKMDRFEFPVLIVLATLGMFMMVSANGLISLYMGLELQSLSLYVIAAINRDNARATEAGLKYFVLGALASGMLLYGASLVYGFTGSVEFTAIAGVLAAEGMNIGVIFGIVFVLAGLAFKISAVPFHMWTPDVYEGAPTPVTAFFGGAPKVAAMALILRILFGAFPSMEDQWQQIIVFISIASMVLGAFAAIGQTNIKRLMAYSSISHMGFALVGLAAGTPEGVRGVLIYLVIYVVMNVGVFCCILAMNRKEGYVESISDLAGLSRNQPMMAFLLAMLMFSLAGVPPLAGFFGKFYVFLAAIEAGLYPLAVIGVLSSVVGAFYYLRVVKVMYFDEPAEPFEQPMPGELAAILGVSSVFTLFFFVYPAPLIIGAQAAVGALLP